MTTDEESLRPIVLAEMGTKVRPALVMTRASIYSRRSMVTLAPISSTIRGLASEVRVGRRNGLQHDSVILIDNIATIGMDKVGRRVGYLLADQEEDLARAIEYAFDLAPA